MAIPQHRSLPLALLLVVAAFGVATAPESAEAHAVLLESTPVRGAILDEAPTEVEFHFNEPVEGSFGAVEVFDSTGSEIQVGEMTRPGGNAEEVGVALPEDLGDGTYTATYRVVSADAHPVSGGLVFTIRDGRGVSSKTIGELLEGTSAGKVTQVGFWFVRWIGYLAIALAIGILGFLAIVWRPQTTRDDRLTGNPGRIAGLRLRSLLAATVIAGAVASLLAIAFQGAIAAGTSLWDAFDKAVFEGVVDTRYGTAMLIRAAGWLALVPALVTVSLMAVRRHRTDAPILALAALATIALCVSPGFGGHASTQQMTWLLFPSDIVHVLAMALWTGGLAALIFVLPPAIREVEPRSARTAVLTDFLLRFSTIALISVSLIAISGTVQAVIEVASFPALIESAFGRAVLIKIVIFTILIALGATNRKRIIPALVARRKARQTPGGPGVAIRRNLRIEAVLVVIVLAVTAALVSYPPPESVQAGPAGGSVDIAKGRLDYTVDPATVGSNEAHFYIFDGKTGAPVNVKSMELSFSLPDSDIPEIEADIHKAGPGHYIAPSAMLSVPGAWQASATVRFSRFEEESASFEVRIP